MGTTMRLGAGAVGLVLMLTGPAGADHYRGCDLPAPVAVYTNADYYLPGEIVTVYIPVDRPSWVMVVEMDEQGFVRRLVGSSGGVRVVPGRPLMVQLQAQPGAGPGFEPVIHTISAIARVGPFRNVHLRRGAFAPAGPCDHCGFDGFCETHFAGGDDRRRGHSQASMARTSYAVLRRPGPWGGSVTVWPAWVWTIPVDARVLVDGVFSGMGVAACLRLPAGQHRVTVVTREGVKENRVLTVGPGDYRREGQSFARRDDRAAAYRYKERH